jgi:hypothetical protein
VVFLREWETRRLFPDHVSCFLEVSVRNDFFQFTLPQDIRNVGTNQFGPLLMNVIAARARAPLTEDQAKIERALWGELERQATFEW